MDVVVCVFLDSNCLVVIVAEPLQVCRPYHGWLSSAVQAGRRGRATTVGATGCSWSTGSRHCQPEANWSRRHRHRTTTTTLLLPGRYSLFALGGIRATVGGFFVTAATAAAAAIARGINDNACRAGHNRNIGSATAGGHYHHIAARERIRR